MPELLIAFFGMLIIIAVAGGFAYRTMQQSIRNKPKPPPLSEYEKHKQKYIETGDIEELSLMQEEMEGK